MFILIAKLKSICFFCKSVKFSEMITPLLHIENSHDCFAVYEFNSEVWNLNNFFSRKKSILFYPYILLHCDDDDGNDIN